MRTLALTAMLLMSTTAYTADGSWSDTTNAAGGFGANAPRGSSDPSEMLGGVGPNQIYNVQRQSWEKTQNPDLSLGTVVDSLYRGMQTVGGWFGRMEGGSDRSLSDGNSFGATDLAGGNCCSSDRLEN